VEEFRYQGTALTNQNSIQEEIKSILQKDEVPGEWRKLHNEEIGELYSPNIVQVIKSRKIQGAGHVACMLGREGVRIQGFGGET
jgi:hypothetical protein